MDLVLLNLPAQIQIAAASGYAAYIASNTGIRGHHTAIETTFGAAAYGLIATGVLALLDQSLGLVLTGTLAFFLTVFAGLVWRKIGYRTWLWFLAKLDVSRADDTPSAWIALSNDPENYLVQIGVELDDGTWLSCDDTAKFANAPSGPCILGPAGDLAFYLTHQRKAGQDERPVTTTRHGTGDRMTYIPAARIRRVTFRRREKPSLRR